MQIDKLLKEGKIIAFPTETIYGLGVLASDAQAVDKIYALKKRSQEKPLTLHISNLEMLECELSDAFTKVAKAFLPGPLTVIVKQREGTLGIRFPSHPVALKLIEAVGEPLYATSANLSGEPPARTAAEVAEIFPEGIALILDEGPEPSGVASTVLSLCDPEAPVILRQGAISEEDIRKVLD